MAEEIEEIGVMTGVGFPFRRSTGTLATDIRSMTDAGSQDGGDGSVPDHDPSRNVFSSSVRSPRRSRWDAAVSEIWSRSPSSSRVVFRGISK